MQLRPYAEPDEEAVVALWRACELTRPWNDPHRDIARKLQVQRHMFLVGEIEGRIVASVMAGFDGHRGWINYLAVHPDFQRRGLPWKNCCSKQGAPRSISRSGQAMPARSGSTGAWALRRTRW